MGTGSTAHVKRSEDSLRESVLSFHQTGHGDQTLFARLGCKCLSLPSHFPSPGFPSLKNVKNISTCDALKEKVGAEQQEHILVVQQKQEDVRGADDKKKIWL